MLRWNQKTFLLISAFALFGYGCLERELRPVNPCTTSEVGRTISIDNVDTVDLLFMVDNSNSMNQEQFLLRMEIPRMVQVLASGDRDGDGTAEFTAVRSMHVGIITSDLGAGNVPAGETVPSCDPGLGDDGIMRNTSRGGTGCLPTYPSRVFAFERDGGGDPAAFAADVGCVADLGTGGCGFEQQLEATLKALSPASPQPFVSSAYVPLTFFGGTFGHGDDPGSNGGFLRPDSALAIVLLTDEEDCSVPEYNIFYMNDLIYAGNPLNLRCSRFGATALYSTDRYVRGFIQLRENPGLLIFAPIVGIPVDLVDSSYEDMLADARLTEIEDTAMVPPQRLLPSCNTDNGVAFPPRRIIEVARGLRDARASTTVQSICAASFGPAIDVIVAKIADALGGACLPRALNQAADGTVGCDVFELLPAAGGTATETNCDDPTVGLERVGSETFTRVDGTTFTRELCLVEQVTPAVGAVGGERGWYYDNVSPEVIGACAATNESPQRIAFSMLRPPTGAEVRLNCNQAILPPSEGVAQLGTFCDPTAASGPTNLCPMGVPPSGTGAFTCDPLARICGVACTSNADCTTAGLLSYVCDTRARSVVSGDDMDGPEPYNFCVNPTCN